MEFWADVYCRNLQSEEPSVVDPIDTDHRSSVRFVTLNDEATIPTIHSGSEPAFPSAPSVAQHTPQSSTVHIVENSSTFFRPNANSGLNVDSGNVDSN